MRDVQAGSDGNAVQGVAVAPDQQRQVSLGTTYGPSVSINAGVLV
jgi:hypothetical protein